MKKFIAVLTVCLLFMGVLAVPALANAANISVGGAQYYESGALKSLTTSFDWTTGSCTSRLVLMTQRLRNAGEPDTYSSYGDFTNFGYYGSMFDNYDEVLAYDNTYHTFGIISASNETDLEWGSDNNNLKFEFDETDIPLSVDKTYYVYLWTHYSGMYYPDNLIYVINVKDGVVSYSPADGQNSYDEDGFQQVGGDPAPIVPDDPTPPDPTDPTPEQPGAPAQIPQTGDAANLALWISLLCVSAAGIVLVGKKARRNY